MMSSQPESQMIQQLTEDRFSSLPKNAIEVILLCLPLRDAVRTSILSRPWRYEWATLPQLVFDHRGIPLSLDQSQSEYDGKLVKIIDHVIILHRGPIELFKLSTFLESCTDVDRWILFLARNGIKKLIIIKWLGDSQFYKLPSSLFSCKDIIYLELFQCTLAPPASFNGFSRLRTLDLSDVSISNDGLENMLTNSTHMEKLILKRLVGCTHLKLWAPNLVDLEIESGFEDVIFQTTPPLSKASILLSNTRGHSGDSYGATCKLITMISSLHGARKLALRGSTFKVLSAGVVPLLLPVTFQLLHLSVAIDFEDIQHLLVTLCIFRSSTLLQKVDIESISGNNREEISVQDFWEAKEHFNCLFAELKILSVREFTGTTSEVKFIEFILDSSPVLEMAQIELEANTTEVLNIYKSLIHLRRISPAARIQIV